MCFDHSLAVTELLFRLALFTRPQDILPTIQELAYSLNLLNQNHTAVSNMFIYESWTNMLEFLGT